MLGSHVSKRELFERFSIPYKGFRCQPVDPFKTIRSLLMGYEPFSLEGANSKPFVTIHKHGILSSADLA